MNADLLGLLSRFVTAVERIADSAVRMADHFAPQAKEKRPATLTTAIYSREERERKELRDHLTGKTPRPPSGAA